jgi:RHS repeat-associated protein
MLTARSCLRLLLAMPLILAICSTCSAQQGVDNAVNTGLPANGVFHGSDIESVQVNNGNLHVDIPIWSVKGRGLDTSAHFVYDTKGWYFDRFCDGFDPCQDTVTALPGNTMTLGASAPFNFQYLGDSAGAVCTYNKVNYHVNTEWTNISVLTPDGTKHHFSPDPITDTPNPCWEHGNTVYADDGSGWILQLGSNGAMVAINKHGTAVSLPTGSTATAVSDSNGNELLTSSGTDTLGRPIQTTSYYDSSGTSRSFVTATTTVSVQTHLCQFRQNNGDTCYEAVGGWTAPSQITLPNGQSYSFTYEPNGGGEIASITLPSGAQISYTYVDGDYGGRAVASRTVTINGVSSTWNYNYTRGGYHNIVAAVATDPNGNDTQYSCLSDSHLGHPAPCYITSAQYYQGSHSTGTLLETVATDYSFYPLNPRYNGWQNVVLPIRETTTWNQQNLVRKVETDWDTVTIQYCGLTGNCGTFTWQNPLERREYDWATGAPGALLKRTHYNYLHLQNSTYLNKNIADRPTSVIVYDGSGTIKAQTTTTYDGSALTGTTGVPNHDYTNFSTSNLVRGNPTTISHWLNPGNTWVNTVNTYDDLGNLLTTTDPLQHATTFSYTDNWANTSCVPSGVNTHGYVTQVTNALNQNTQTSYYPCTGLVASRKDQNDINASRAGTTYSYDFFGRMTQKNTPDGGLTSVSYNDAPPVSNTTTIKINSTPQNAVTTRVFDGIGRVIQTQLTSDPQGTVYTDTTYDLLGRVATASNPYRTGTDITTTTGITTYGYDALSRKTTETYPDNSVLTTAYCGPSTLVTDPTGKWRRSRADGLGRLVEVDEPNAPGASVNSNGCPGTGEPIWVTSYTYDGLSNLTQVVQNGSHQRNFAYDSLSHLLTSTNPEVGQITYAYNNDGVLISKTDARNITTNYSPSDSPIDALHRVTKITYSNSDPSVTFAYDQANCLALPHCDNIGHRTSMTDAAGSESWSFDVADRIHKEQRTTSGITKSTTYNLDLAGNITSVVYPTSRTVNYTYDSADRPSTAIDSANGITYATGLKTSPGGTCLANVTCYTPQGSFYALSIGQTSTFTGLNLTHTYNSRLQPNEFKASSTGGNAIDITYGFVDPVSGKNAGHVYAITNNLDTTRSQTFTYDQLSRISSALTTSTHATSPTHCWGETYSLDSWGNLQSIAATTNSNYTGCSGESGFSTTADGNNHLNVFSYDTSGNTQNDGVNSYNWDAESQLKSAAGVNYLYDGDGRRVSKSSGKLYWYGSGGEILAETDASGNTTAEYIFFGGKRVAQVPANGNPIYYVEDLLGTSRVITTNTGVVCYDADFYPYGGERPYTNTCPQNYKFEGKERDTETGNDDFGARYYSNRFGRWLSADWSSVPVPVPYANLTNPQTLNLYAMVADDPESFVDLDGHKITLSNNEKKKRRAAELRLTSNLSASEKKQFEVVKTKDDKYILQARAGASDALKSPHTKAFEMLLKTSQAGGNVNVSISETFQYHVGDQSVTDSVADHGGGVTIGPSASESGETEVHLSAQGASIQLADTNGNPIPSPKSIVAAHEVMGHARRLLLGLPNTEHRARSDENEVRNGRGLPPRPNPPDPGEQ